MLVVWRWLKKYWKWILFPIGIISVILAWVSRGGRIPPLVSGTTDEAADEALEDYKKASQEYKEKLDEIHKKAEERLKDASEEQLKEYEEIKDKPLEEVAKWIDSLS